MKIGRLTAAAVMCVCVATTNAGPIVGDPGEFGSTVRAAVSRVAPSVVRIVPIGGVDAASEGVGSAGLRAESTVGPTTGLVVTADGLIVTSSFALLGSPAALLAELPDGRTLAATRVAADRSTLLTLLRVDPGDTPLVPATPARASSATVGRTAVAVGRAFSRAAPNVSTGIVSATERMRGRAVQTDAKISPLNYGGPLVDLEGGVIGVLTPIGVGGAGVSFDLERYDSGIGFAVPLTGVLESLPELAAGKDRLPGLLGMTFRGGTPLIGEPVVGTVRPGSPADAIGLEPGDVIVSADGKPIDRQVELLIALGTKYAGDAISITYRRDDETRRGEAELAPELVPYARGYLGVVGEDTRARQGIVVKAVDPDGPAAAAGLVAGDVIIGIGWEGKFLRDVAAMRARMAATAPGEKTEVQVDRPSGEVDGFPVILTEVSAAPFAVRTAETPAAVITDTLTVDDFEIEGWTLTPEGDSPVGLLVFLHADGRPRRDEAIAAFRPLAASRGVAVVGPTAGVDGSWKPASVRAVTAAVKQFREGRALDGGRVAVVGIGTGGFVAASVAFAERDLFRGLVVCESSPRLGVPPNDPDLPLLVLRSDRRRVPDDDGFLTALRGEKYPVAVRNPAAGDVDGDGPIDLEDLAPTLGDWIDGLPRL